MDHTTRAALAEAIGTFFLVLVGCGAAIVAGRAGLGAVGVALAFGLVILVLVYALGHVSGAHFNPAITIAFAASGHFPWRRVGGYLLAQLGGALAASFVLRALLGGVAPAITRSGLSAGSTIAIEALTTFLLAFVIVSVATDRRAPAAASGLAIGGTVLVDALAFGSLTGASMNPARSLGPAIAGGEYAALWIYVVAPIAGAILAMLAYNAIRGPREASA